MGLQKQITYPENNDWPLLTDRHKSTWMGCRKDRLAAIFTPFRVTQTTLMNNCLENSNWALLTDGHRSTRADCPKNRFGTFFMLFRVSAIS
jgi:hypothetical protein